MLNVLGQVRGTGSQKCLVREFVLIYSQVWGTNPLLLPVDDNRISEYLVKLMMMTQEDALGA